MQYGKITLALTRASFTYHVHTMVVFFRSIGTFARALLDGAKKPQISLRLGAAAASRDITLFHAMDTLHLNSYDITQATSCLVPRGPVLCADELEAWTQGVLMSSECMLYVCAY